VRNKKNGRDFKMATRGRKEKMYFLKYTVGDTPGRKNYQGQAKL
jgi:hypothetical protein